MPWGAHSIARGLMPPALLIPNRGKKKATKKKNMIKDSKSKEIKDFINKREMQKLLLSATLKAASKGDPFDPEMLNPARKRKPTVHTKEEKERRILLSKKWHKNCMKNHIQELQFLQGVVRTRKKALSELRKTSHYLYNRALELQPDLFPLECNGPTVTPPIPGYVPPDPEE